MLTLLTLSLFSLGLLSCSSTPNIYKSTELDSVKELKTGQKIVYYSSDEGLATYLKLRLEAEIPVIDSKYDIRSLPVTFYIIPTYQDWKNYYGYRNTIFGIAYSRFDIYDVFVLATSQYKFAGDQYANCNISHTGFSAATGYENHVKRLVAKQQKQ